MTLDEIKALPVTTRLAADDCVLFLWATVAMLEEAFEVMKAWGFCNKSNMAWDKEIIGTGYWARNQHEHLLIAVRGDPPASYAIIEAMYPDLPKLELFARQARSGRDVWGNETGKFAESA
jgi:N6-adenosine-specific RNA methylase IME4